MPVFEWGDQGSNVHSTSLQVVSYIAIQKGAKSYLSTSSSLTNYDLVARALLYRDTRVECIRPPTTLLLSSKSLSPNSKSIWLWFSVGEDLYYENARCISRLGYLPSPPTVSKVKRFCNINWILRSKRRLISAAQRQWEPNQFTQARHCVSRHQMAGAWTPDGNPILQCGPPHFIPRQLSDGGLYVISFFQ